MRIDRWLQLKRTKALCIGLATLFGVEQAWGADPTTLSMVVTAFQQEGQLRVVRTEQVQQLYQDLYGRAPTPGELKDSIAFLNRTPQMAAQVARLSQSPEARWKLRQLNPARLQREKDRAARLGQAVSRMVGEVLRQQATGHRLQAASDRLQAPGYKLQAETQAPGSRLQASETAPGSRLKAEGNSLEPRASGLGPVESPGHRPQAAGEELTAGGSGQNTEKAEGGRQQAEDREQKAAGSEQKAENSGLEAQRLSGE
ncbi:MAG: hypothetical protein HYZ89_00355, partial [Candidatus Omnitrophica bacterium]|nr:hypothetical protein [Candidatus Omnitrophota bacterium]